MGQVARGGRTVLFVSHNMATVQNLCSKAVLLASGRVQAMGPVAEVLSAYLLPHSASDDHVPLSSFRPAGMTSIIQEVRVYNHEGVPTSHVYAGAGVTFEMVYESPIPLKRPVFCVYIQGMNGEPLVHLHTRSQHPEVPSVADRGVVRCHVPSLPLFPGSYSLSFSCAMVHTDGVLDFLDRAVSLEVEPADYFGTGRLPMRKYGVFLVRADWTLPHGAADDTLRGRLAEWRGGVA